MNRNQAVELLRQHKQALKERYGVVRLSLFGSTARNTADETSDIDLLVEFDGPATSERYFGTQFYIEDLFNQPVDLVTPKAIRKELRESIEHDALVI